jgi:hypothetical protein
MRRGQKIRNKEKLLRLQENVLLQKEYAFLISVIRETKNRSKEMTDLQPNLDPIKITEHSSQL